MSALRPLFVVIACVGSLTAGLARATPPMIPPAMVDACKHVAEGGPCQFSVGGGKQITGSCRPLPNQELACRPGGPKPKAKAKPKPAPSTH